MLVFVRYFTFIGPHRSNLGRLVPTCRSVTAPPPLLTQQIKGMRVMIGEAFEDPVNIESTEGKTFSSFYLNRCFLTHSVEQMSL